MYLCSAMKKNIWIAIVAVVLLSSCAQEFNRVYKSGDARYRYEYAKEAFLNGKYSHATTLLENLVSYSKGTDNAEESLFLLGMSQYNGGDYESAALTFNKYFTTYTKGKYAELACYYIGQSQYMSTPEPRLDQTETYAAIHSFQDYLDIYPDATMKELVQDKLYALQDKLVMKELHNAKLYYDLGTYFGNCAGGENNYDACIITAQNALKDYPYTKRREDFAVLILKSKYELAGMSVDARRIERYQDAEDEAYGFINEYPDSKNVNMARRYIERCHAIIEKLTKDLPPEEDNQESLEMLKGFKG